MYVDFYWFKIILGTEESSVSIQTEQLSLPFLSYFSQFKKYWEG